MASNNCANCESEFGTSRYIHCTECTTFDLCLECFSSGAEIGNHRKEHSYRIVPQTTKIAHVFETAKPWSIAEETMLLDAVEQYGFGNWEDVANHVKSRTIAECHDHFVTFYIHGNVGAVCFPDDSSRSNYRPIADSTPPVRINRAGGTNSETGSGNNGESKGLTNGTTTPTVDLSASEQKDLGYMMFRGDFEREYDNEAENVISSLEINYDDEEMDILFKLSQVDRYRYRLADREQRKVLAREFGLLSSATIFTTGTSGGKPKSQQTKKTKSSSSGSSSSKDDKEIVEKLRVFARFLSFKDHKQYCDNLQREKDLRSQIKELSRYRRNGLTKTDEVDAFEDHKNKKERRVDRNKKTSNSSSTNKRSTSSSLSSSASKKNEGKTELNDDNDDENMDDDDTDNKDMSSLPNFEQLSSSEKKLCNNLRLTPSNYITIKTCIIKDYLQRKQGQPVKIKYPSYLDKTHRRKIITFLSNNGWICVT